MHGVGWQRTRWILPLVATAFIGSVPVASGSSPSHPAGLGLVVSTAGGGQIFGWDVNQHGLDGLLATSKTTRRPGVYKVSVQTFDQDTGAITEKFAVDKGKRDSYASTGSSRVTSGWSPTTSCRTAASSPSVGTS